MRRAKRARRGSLQWHDDRFALELLLIGVLIVLVVLLQTCEAYHQLISIITFYPATTMGGTVSPDMTNSFS